MRKSIIVYNLNVIVGEPALVIYLDTAPLIYFIDHVPQYSDLVAQQLAATDTLVVSDLSRLECRVKPMRDCNTVLLSSSIVFSMNR